MSLTTQEDDYLSVDCKECNFNLLVVHEHNHRDQLLDLPQYGPPSEAVR